MNMIVSTYAIEEGDFTLDLHANAYVVEVQSPKSKSGRPLILVYKPCFDWNYSRRSIPLTSEISPRRFRSLEVNATSSTEMDCQEPSNVFRVVGTYWAFGKKQYVLFEECRFGSTVAGTPPSQYPSYETFTSDESLVRNTL